MVHWYVHSLPGAFLIRTCRNELHTTTLPGTVAAPVQLLIGCPLADEDQTTPGCPLWTIESIYPSPTIPLHAVPSLLSCMYLIVVYRIN